MTLAEVDGKPTITTFHLQVRRQLPGLKADESSVIGDEAVGLCPVSRLFADAGITVDAVLDESA